MSRQASDFLLPLHDSITPVDLDTVSRDLLKYTVINFKVTVIKPEVLVPELNRNVISSTAGAIDTRLSCRRQATDHAEISNVSIARYARRATCDRRLVK